MLPFVKRFSSFGGFIMLAVGLFLVASTICALVRSDDIINYQNMRQLVIIALISVSAVVLIMAILGIIGVMKKNFYLTFAYQIFVIIFLVFFLALGIGSLILPGQMFNGDCTTSTTQLITKANRAYTGAQQVFCRAPCSCNFAQSSIDMYSDSEKQIISTYNVNASGVLAAQRCQYFSNWTDQDQRLANIIGQVQTVLQCSRWCQSTQINLIYYFSDVNNGKPSSNCYPALKNAITKYSNVVSISSLIIAAIFLVVMTFNICIWCHPDNKDLDFKTRVVNIKRDDSQMTGYERFQQ